MTGERRNSFSFIGCAVLGLALGLGGCQNLFQYSPNEVRLSESEQNLNARYIARLEATPPRDTFRFVLIGDTQRFYEELDDFVPEVNRLPGVAFVLVAGDISDFGLVQEFRWVHERLQHLKVPYVAVIGNHDMLANGREVFRRMYGPENFSFSYSGCKFICLNTNSNEVGNDGTIPDLDWLAGELADLSAYRHAFVVGHMAPFHESFDPRLEAPYAALMAAHPTIRFSMHGHQHTYSLSSPYGDGVQYLATGAMNDRNYILITVEGDHCSAELRTY